MTVNTDPGLPKDDGGAAETAETAETAAAAKGAKGAKGANGAKAKRHPLGDLAVGLVLLLAGTFIGVDDIVDGHRDRQLVSTGVQVQGTVTEVVFEQRRKKSDKKVVTAVYQVTKGQTYSVTYRETYRSKEEGTKAEVTGKLRGSAVTVFHDRTKPWQAVVQGQEASVGMGYFIIAFFALLSSVFLVPLVKGLKKKADPADAGAGTTEAR